MNKTVYVILSIITLGIYPAIVHDKAKKTTSPSLQIQTTQDAEIDVPAFVNLLGTIDNIVSVTSTISSLIVILKETVEINEEDKSKFDIHGVLINDKKYTFIFGDNANAIKEEINALLTSN